MHKSRRTAQVSQGSQSNDAEGRKFKRRVISIWYHVQGSKHRDGDNPIKVCLKIIGTLCKILRLLL